MLRALKAAFTPNLARIRRQTWRGWDRASEYPYSHHTDAAEAARECRERGDDERAVELLRWCLDYVEAEARQEYFMDIPPGYYEELADVHREAGRPEAEVTVLERYVETI